MIIAILSAPVIPVSGVYEIRTIDLAAAMRLIDEYEHEVFTSHQSIKILGLSPSDNRGEANFFELALWIKPKERLEFGREYSRDDIERIGYDIWLLKLIEELG